MTAGLFPWRSVSDVRENLTKPVKKCSGFTAKSNKTVLCVCVCVLVYATFWGPNVPTRIVKLLKIVNYVYLKV